LGVLLVEEHLRRPARGICCAVVSGHNGSVGRVGEEPRKGDSEVEVVLDWVITPEQLAARDDRVRRAIETTPSVFPADCNAARVRLFDYSIELRDDPQCYPDAIGLEQAARQILRAYNRDLGHRKRSKAVDAPAAFELESARSWALSALRLIYLRAGAVKKVELEEAEPGQLLAICIGGAYSAVAQFGGRHPVAPLEVPMSGLDKPLVVPARGCLRIFNDPGKQVGGGRNQWPRWCPDCDPSKGQTRRSQISAHQRSVRAASPNR
jgi:hypothetical protein